MQYMTEKQAQVLCSNYRFLQQAGADGPEALGQALARLCDGLDPASARQSVEQLAGGIQRFRQAYASGQEGTDPQAVVSAPVQGLNEQQRRGLYLQCYEFLRASDAEHLADAQAGPTAVDLAARSEEELLDLITQQLQAFSQQLAGDALHGAQAPSALPESADPLVLAAAAYAAGVNGDLPESFQQHPDLVGVCCAARDTLTQELLQTGGDEEAAASVRERVLQVLGGVLLTVAVTVILCGLSMLVGEAVCVAMDLVLALGTTTLYHLLVPILEVCLYGVAALAGLAAVLGLLSLPVLGIWLAGEGCKRAAALYQRHDSTAKHASIPERDEAEEDLGDLEETGYSVQA